jgi:tRNA pseudouridine55 synthase
VLPVFVGQATRAVSFAEPGDKEYVAGLHLGCVTNTQDTSGDVLEQRPVHVTRQELEALLPRFTGEVMQVPPMYSAIKINGQKLYQLARQGKTWQEILTWYYAGITVGPVPETVQTS